MNRTNKAFNPIYTSQITFIYTNELIWVIKNALATRGFNKVFAQKYKGLKFVFFF